MNILVIVPRFTSSIGDYYDLPLGISYITAVLKQNNFKVRTLNLNLHEHIEPEVAIQQELQKHATDVVCIGGLTYFYHSVKQICKAAKKTDPRITLVVGGGLVSSEPELMLNALNADYIVIGEGEETIVELMESLSNDIDPRFVQGIGYLRKKNTIITAKRPDIEDLDSLPFPDFEQFDVDNYFKRQTPNSDYYLYIEDNPRFLPIITSRSCPLNCTFCYHPIGKNYRIRSLDNIFEEVELLIKKYQINSIIPLDELMTVSKKRMNAFCEGIKPYGLNWICQLKVNVANQDLLHKMRDSGCYYISYGIESASNPILDSMKKYNTVEEIEVGLAQTKKANIGIQGNFLFGDPKETLDTANETLDWWKEHGYYHINLSEILPYPGSEDYNYALKKGLITDKLQYIESGCPPLNMTDMPDSQYAQLISKLDEYKLNHRQYGKLVSIDYTHFDDFKQCDMHRLLVKCPHCEQNTTYNNFHQKDPVVFKLACRQCGQRFDLLPTIFPKANQHATQLKQKLDSLAKQQTPIVLTPCIPDHALMEYTNIYNINWDGLNIIAAMDLDATKQGTSYLDKFDIVPRNKGSFDSLPKEIEVIILPSANASVIQNDLMKTCKLTSDRVHSIGMI